MMNENKRFNVKQRQGATNYSIIDYYGELPLSEGMYYKSNANKLCEWLNTQHELLDTLYNENEQLKQSNQELNDELQETMGYLALKSGIEKENEQLKSALKELKEIGDYQHDRINELHEETEQLKQQLSDINGQLVMLDNCDNWDYDRMKHTVREIAEIIGYNGTINPKR